jgi:hypothetical protein
MKELPMTALAVAAPAAPARAAVRRTGPSLPTLVVLEIRKSLSTRSGKALVTAAALLAPAAMAVAATASAEPIRSALGPVLAVGVLTSYVMFSLGALSTAGEWSHRSMQTTYLLVPGRGRVLTSKAAAVALVGAFFTGVGAALSAGVLATVHHDLAWAGVGRGLGVVVAAGAVFAAVGAGVGAALANTPATLTGLYLTLFGVMPVLANVQPTLEQKTDPAAAVLNLGNGTQTTTSILVLTGWVVVSVVAGTILTHRRAVQ